MRLFSCVLVAALTAGAATPPPDAGSPPVFQQDSTGDRDAGFPSAASAVPSDSRESEELVPIESLDIESLLNSTTVTASGKEETRALAAANVVTVTRDDIERQGWRSLAEVLANTPGIYVIDDHVTPSVGVRGVTAGLGGGTRIVRVMIDGVAVNFRPDLTGFIGPEFIPMEVVDRVEIAKGPLSALHGANAFLATVNVITRKPKAGAHGDVLLRSIGESGNPGYGGTGAILFGSEGYEAIVSYAIERTNRDGLAIQQTFPLQNPALPRYAPFFGDVSRGDISQPSGGFLMLRKRSELLGNFTLEGGLQHLDRDGEFRLNSVLTHSSRVAIDNYWGNLRWERALGERLSLTANIGASMGDANRDYRLELTSLKTSSYTPRYNYFGVNGAVEGYYDGGKFNLRIGVDGEFNRQRTLFYTQTFNVAVGDNEPGTQVDLIGSNDDRHENVSDLAAYAQLSTAPFASLPDLQFTVNLRADVITYGPVNFPVQLSWRGAIAYRLSQTATAKVIVGRAFQTPSGALMFAHAGFGSANNVIGNASNIGAPALRPQSVTSAEAVVGFDILQRAAIEAGLFVQEINDRIEFAQLGSDFTAINSTSGRSAGLELTTHVALGRLSPFASVSLIQQLSDDSGGFGQPARQYPFAFALAGAHLDVPEVHLRATAQLRYVGERASTQSNTLLNNSKSYKLPGFALVDVTVSTMNLEPFGPGTRTELLASVRNVLDSRYSEPYFGGFDVPQFGRTFLVQLRQSF